MPPSESANAYDLRRFLEAQEFVIETVLSELKSGQKRTHWMWFIFPQIDGLASSSMAKLYAIKGVGEARAYLAHPVLGPRLLECAAAVMQVEGKSARQMFGSPDDVKLRSCATLFASVAPGDSVFERLLAKYFPEGHDEKTLQLLEGTR